MKKKIFSLLVLLVTAVTGAWAQTTYTVAGSNAAMFGTAWDASNTANDMTKNGDGTYSITYTNVYLDDDVQYKVLKDHSWGEAYPAVNRVIDIAEAGTYTVTIHFNPTTHEVYETMPGAAPTYDLKVGTNAQGTVKFYVAETEVTKAEEGATVTVVITPAEGWCTKEVTARGYVGWEVASSRQRVPMDMVDDLTVTGEGNAWTFDMPAANALVNVTYKKLLTNQDILVVDIDDVTYNGQYLTPEVTVKDGNTVLTKDVDYSLSYADNKNAGTATVTITGIGEKYAGEITKQFTIDKANAFVKFDPNTYVKTYGDEPFTLNATIIGDGFYYYYGSSISEIVISDKNEEYYDEKFFGVVDVDGQTGEVTIVGPGRAYVYLSMLEGDNYYPSTVTICRIDVLPKDASTLTVEQAEGEVLTDADAKAPTLTVKDGDNELVEGKDYTISYADAEGNALEEMPTAAGTYNVVVTFTGFYGGTKSVTYTIAESGTTGVNEVKEVNEVNEVSDDTIYDLNGRKVNGQLKKGVYIMNGKKVVIK